MSHNPYHDPTPTPTSKPDDHELDSIGTLYSDNYDSGHVLAFNRARTLKAHVAAGTQAAAVAATTPFKYSAQPDHTGDPVVSGLLDGYWVGFLKGIYSLRLEYPAQSALL